MCNLALLVYYVFIFISSNFNKYFTLFKAANYFSFYEVANFLFNSFVSVYKISSAASVIDAFDWLLETDSSN